MFSSWRLHGNICKRSWMKVFYKWLLTRPSLIYKFKARQWGTFVIIQPHTFTFLFYLPSNLYILIKIETNQSNNCIPSNCPLKLECSYYLVPNETQTVLWPSRKSSDQFLGTYFKSLLCPKSSSSLWRAQSDWDQHLVTNRQKKVGVPWIFTDLTLNIWVHAIVMSKQQIKNGDLRLDLVSLSMDLLLINHSLFVDLLPYLESLNIGWHCP